MASSSSSHQHNVEHLAFSGIEPDTKRRRISESSRLFDVFINHRGPDAKKTLADHLYKSLQEWGLRPFLDSEEIELGDYFPNTLETAIRSASAHIAIFSKGYAESAWCLAELDLMLQSKAKIFPLFYGVEPWELRLVGKGVYAKAFANYANKGRYLEKLESWKKALHSTSLFKGIEIDDAESFGSSEGFKNLVLDVHKEVERTKPLFVVQHPVALHKLVKDFESQCLDKLVHDFENQCGLNIQGNDHSKIVGIFGKGGAGKTTLAKELFNRKRSDYNAKCFLFDVRDKSSRFGLPSLQAELLRGLFNENTPEFRSREEGSNYVRHRLERSKFLSFLIVVDDIDHVKQLDTLCLMDMANNSHNCLVIVTTRDAGVLTRAGITNRYNLKELNRDDGKELFCWHSFGLPNPASGFENLVDAFVEVCGGLPLSLQVLGRHVHGRPVCYWELQLCEVRESLHPDIKDILKISFDALNRVEKQIFMDIACFFVDKSKNTAIRVWEGSGWGARYALETLKDRCLVEEGEGVDGLPWEDEPVVLKMHDHLRDLGREMSGELNSPPRHWSPKHHKSLETKGFENILAQTKGRCFHSFYDTSMGSQITYFIGQSEECGETSSSLLWLQLNLYYTELSSIPPWIPLENLQCLRIKYGCFKRLWQSNVQAPSQLKELQIRTTTLEEFPDFSGISNNLERVVLDASALPIQGWYLLESLRVYPRSLVLASSTLRGELDCNNRGEKTTSKSSRFNSLVIENFVKLSDELSLCNIRESTALRCPLSDLESLEINHQIDVTKILICGNYCPGLLSLKIHDMGFLTEMNLLRVETLKCLEINTCRSLERLPETSYFRNLVECKITQCPKLKELSLAHLTSLEILRIENCEKLKILSGLSNHRKLLKLDIIECLELQELPCFGSLTCVEHIRILTCVKLQNIHLEGCEKLREIDIENCWKLQKISLPTTVISLSVKDCRELQRVVSIGDLTELRGINISWCPELEELPSLPRMRCLEVIEIDYCWKLVFEDLHLRGMQFLERITLDTSVEVKYLELDSCEKLQSIILPTTLLKVWVKSCKNLQSIKGIADLTKLTFLEINQCPVLEELPSLARLSCLEKIQILFCEKLQSIILPTTLLTVWVKSCRDLQSIEGIADLTKLTFLKIDFCWKLVFEDLCLRGMQFLERITLDRSVKVKYLALDSCEKLQSIILPTTLLKVWVKSCKNLHSIKGIADLTKLTFLEINQCPVLEELPSLAGLSCLEEIQILFCEKLQSIILPTTLLPVWVESCRDLHTIEGISDLTKLTLLRIEQCPALEELPSLAGLSCLEKIRIHFCEKLQSIILPTTLLSVWVKSCRDLHSIEGISDLTKLTSLEINQCPALEELPSLAGLSCLEEIRIHFCEKLQSIILPTTLLSVWVKSCRDLHSIEGISDLTKLTSLEINQCPALEELPSLARLSCLEEIEIGSCEKLESIAGVEELQVLEYLELSYYSNALIRNCIHKLKCVPSVGMVMIGGAVHGAESILNENLFCDANIGVDGVIEIGTQETQCVKSELSTIIECYVVTSDSSEEDINIPPTNLIFNKVCEGEWIITVILCNALTYNFHDQIDVLRRYRIMKGFRAEMKRGEGRKCVGVLRTIVDRLHHL